MILRIRKSVNVMQHLKKYQIYHLREFEEHILEQGSKFDLKSLSEDEQRQFKFIISKPLPQEEQLELSEIISEMSEIYNTEEVCFNKTESGDADSKSKCHTLSPGLSNIMKESLDFQERKQAWQGWRVQAGRKMKPLYERYVELKNQKARLNNFTDQGDLWRSNYETETFESDVMGMYEELRPLYQELHAYVRRNLHSIYGEDVPPNGTIPANVLGDMWGRFWNNLYPLMIPYPNKPNLQPSKERMASQNMTVETMFKTTEKFYTDMGFEPLFDSFWNHSMFKKPEDGRVVQCHPTAWDFGNKQDFRIKMCATDYSFHDFLTIHHEMGHTIYQMQYRHLPYQFQRGANNGFHEAIGELMAMNAATPSYLYKLGLIDELVDDEESDINFLLSQSLITISTLPFHLVNDVWRWRVFSGEFPQDQWNNEFWKLKREMVGVHPPVPRTPKDLDPPTLFHINQDYTMMRYFTRTILQFQFAEELCREAGHEGPLHRCSFAGSKAAGAKLGEMLSLGGSVPWQEALDKFAGIREMSVKPIVKFFQPLYEWLKKKNIENGDIVGW
ncbi:angiotensin-converting enzyme 2-like isoform X2 [Tigriopus californicus]|uniref:angiotensin-converting enzyme 2-like isoform X2 n=1 Tax=Tigriopus californicus TaxID=6832 RepID=UPI0027DA3C6C|nr:angiotensin-converting enzyme 2-like isoform X2 [Tigriopus californicus]